VKYDIATTHRRRQLRKIENIRFMKHEIGTAFRCDEEFVESSREIIISDNFGTLRQEAVHQRTADKASGARD